MLAAVSMAAVLAAACEKKPVATAPPPPPEVYVADVVTKDVPMYVELVGQAVGFQDAEAAKHEDRGYRQVAHVAWADVVGNPLAGQVTWRVTRPAVNMSPN